MSIVGKMDSTGMTAMMHGGMDHDRRTTLALDFHATGRETSVQVTLWDGYCTASLRHEGGTLTLYLTLAQAKELHDELGRVLVEARVEAAEVPA